MSNHLRALLSALFGRLMVEPVAEPVEFYDLPCGCRAILHNDGRDDDPFVLHLLCARGTP